MKLIKLTILSITLLLPFFANAADQMATSIVVVDIQKVLQESSAAKDIRQQIKIKRDRYQNDITKQEDKLRKDEKKLSEQRSILSPEAFEKRRDEFKESLIKVQRDVQVKRAKLDGSLSKSLNEVQQVVYQIIESLSGEKEFQLAVPTSQVLFAEESLNITGEVLKRLDKKLPKIKLKDD